MFFHSHTVKSVNVFSLKFLAWCYNKNGLNQWFFQVSGLGMLCSKAAHAAGGSPVPRSAHQAASEDPSIPCDHQGRSESFPGYSTTPEKTAREGQNDSPGPTEAVSSTAALTAPDRTLNPKRFLPREALLSPHPDQAGLPDQKQRRGRAGSASGA